jgi:hypothetical protein
MGRSELQPSTATRHLPSGPRRKMLMPLPWSVLTAPVFLQCTAPRLRVLPTAARRVARGSVQLLDVFLVNVKVERAAASGTSNRSVPNWRVAGLRITWPTTVMPGRMVLRWKIPAAACSS